eukprot:GHVO01003051.1.p1 GENE.GHVO01003051.1~~GHVO01003051.1.p1  ORF type:complete len:111 (-),score=3.83 GHVO01003051.1:121-453(-)
MKCRTGTDINNIVNGFCVCKLDEIDTRVNALSICVRKLTVVKNDIALAEVLGCYNNHLFLTQFLLQPLYIPLISEMDLSLKYKLRLSQQQGTPLIKLGPPHLAIPSIVCY